MAQNDRSEEITIRQLREQSNAAIARHDVGPARAILHDNARIIGSNGDFFNGADAMARAFAERFADPNFVTYIRAPDSIDVDGTTAAEAGTWIGRWKDREVQGTYLARWNREPAGWRIVAELFIPLGRT